MRGRRASAAQRHSGRGWLLQFRVGGAWDFSHGGPDRQSHSDSHSRAQTRQLGLPRAADCKFSLYSAQVSDRCAWASASTSFPRALRGSSGSVLTSSARSGRQATSVEGPSQVCKLPLETDARGPALELNQAWPSSRPGLPRRPRCLPVAYAAQLGAVDGAGKHGVSRPQQAQCAQAGCIQATTVLSYGTQCT